MSKIRIHEPAKLDWLRVADVAAPHLVPRLGDAELASHVAFHELGDESSLQLFEIAYEPGAAIEVHSHQEDEIIYVVAGSMKLGPKTVPPGTSVFVSADTLYSFEAGPEGLRMLNFRPRRDDSFVTREEHLEKHRRGRATA